MPSVHRLPPIALRPLSAQQYRVAMGLSIAGLPYRDIQQLAPRAFGLTLRSGRPAAFRILVGGQEAGPGAAQIAVIATLVDDADSQEAFTITSDLMSTLPVWCEVVWAMGIGQS
jgi:hypothetical protein